MSAAVGQHRYLKAGVALAAASVVAVAPTAPVTPLPSATSVVEGAVRPADADSILNVPFHLFQDIANIGANEIDAVGQAAKSLFYATNFFVPSATNIFGTDPGDLLHYNSIFGLLFPFSRNLSGIGSPTAKTHHVRVISLLAATETNEKYWVRRIFRARFATPAVTPESLGYVHPRPAWRSDMEGHQGRLMCVITGS